jgi:hypothetical protein
MSVIKVSKILEETIEESAVSGATVVPTQAIRVYEVTTAMADGAEIAMQATDGVTSVPTPGTQWDAVYTALKSRPPRVSRVGTGGLWRVTVPYSVTSVTFGGRKAVSPTSRATIYSDQPQPFQTETDKDSAGNIIRNKVDEVKTISVWGVDHQIVVTWNKATKTDYSALESKVNDGNVTIDGTTYAAHKLLCLGVSSETIEEEYEGEFITYYRRTATFVTRSARSTGDPADWKEKVLHQGTKYIVSGVTKAIVDANDNLIIEPQMLTDAGALTTTPYYYSAYNTYSSDAASRLQMYATATFTTLVTEFT